MFSKSRSQWILRLALAAAAVVAAVVVPAALAGSCGGLLQPTCARDVPYVPAPDPGGDESAAVPMPAPGRLFGFTSNASAGPNREMPPEKEYDLAAAAGANVQRIDVFWSYMEPNAPSGGVHRYSGAAANDYGVADDIDERYNAMLARGIKPLLVLHSAPPWAQAMDGHGNPRCPGGEQCMKFIEPAGEHIADWWALANWAAKRWPAAAFEIWNEPNLKSFYQPAPDAQRYLRLFESAYGAIKKANPNADVVVGGINGHPATDDSGISNRDFLSALYNLGIKSKAPGFRLGIHLYPEGTKLGTGSRYAKQWDRIVDVMEAARDMSREVWVTETGVSTTPASKQGEEYEPGQFAATPAQQQDILRRTYNRLMTMDRTGLRKVFVRAAILYTLTDISDHFQPEDHGYGYGVLGDRPPYPVKPAYCSMVHNSPPGAPVRTYPGC